MYTFLVTMTVTCHIQCQVDVRIFLLCTDFLCWCDHIWIGDV